MPHVSIIVPVYKVEQYLHRCIDSILGQTFSDFELILVDDESPDNCGAICNEYAAMDSRITAIHKKNGGVAAARNSALEIATGSYVAFCDSDDWWEPMLLETAFATAEAHNADCVVYNYAKIEDGKKVSQTHFESGVFDISDKKSREAYIISKMLRFKHGYEVWDKIFRKEIIDDHSLTFCTTSGNYGEDYGFQLKYMLYANKVVCINDCFYNYQVRSDSITHADVTNFRLNELNEVCKDLELEFKKSNLQTSKIFPIIHFLALNQRYELFVGKAHYSSLPKALATIQDQKWYRNQVRKLFLCYKELVSYFGIRIAKQILYFSTFCLHRNWKLYCIESAIFYKFIV